MVKSVPPRECGQMRSDPKCEQVNSAPVGLMGQFTAITGGIGKGLAIVFKSPSCGISNSEIVPFFAVLRLIKPDVLLAYRDLESQRLVQNKADPDRADNCVHHRNRGSFELQEELV